MNADSRVRPRHVAVIGAGRMGRGIALACLLADVPVLLVDLKERTSEDAARVKREAQADVERDLGFLVSLGLLDAAAISVPALLQVLGGAEAGAAIESADLVFEGVPETLEAKSQAFAWVSSHAAPDAIVASTTSTMNVDELARYCARPQRFLNAHWLNPAHLMPLVEIAVGRDTDPAVVQRLRDLLVGLGKVPVTCTASPGYIVPRIQALAMNEAARLREEGVASAEDIDTAIRVGFGLRFAVLGLLEFIDWGGNDILYYASSYLSRTVDADRYAVPAVVERNMREGRNGLREGQGFYDYRDRDVEAYRRQRLVEFVRLVGQRGLLPPRLQARAPRSN